MLVGSIEFAHGFSVVGSELSYRFASAPVGVFGLVVVRRWATGFRECLLKVFHDRFSDPKSADSSNALALIQAGELPIRLRLPAFLSLQEGYVSLPLFPEYSTDRALEEKLLRRDLGDVDESRCRLSFDRYQRLLCDYLPQYRFV